jgi:arylsulfatase
MSDAPRYPSRRAFLLGTAATTALAGCAVPSQQSGRPNFLMIVVDDMGFSDLGCFGGEIKTPNIDALAAQGCLFSNFHTAPTCSPTRSMLLTGADNHVVGLGNMKELLADNQKGRPGYEGYLNGRVPTVASLLRNAGYHTYLSGKWHLGYAPEQLPVNQGFEESTMLAEGGADNYEKKSYTPTYAKVHFYEGLKEIDLPKDFYSTKFWTDRMLGYIDKNATDGKPFFGFLSYQALHQPHQVDKEFSEPYIPTYTAGWNAIQKARYERQQKMGLMPAGMNPRLPKGVPAWDAQSAQDKRTNAKRMAVYAGMLEYLDRDVGRIVAHLKAKNLLDNTVIMLMSDNGGEGTDLLNIFPDYYKQNFDLSYERMGERGTYSEYGPGWAAVSVTPLNGLKVSTNEGGIRAPLIMRHPAGVRAGVRSDEFTHVTDLVPTILEMAGVNPAAEVKAKLDGKSLAKLLANGTAARGADDAVVMELAGNIMVFRDGYKMVRNLPPLGNGAWHLYDLRRDPGESRDLMASEPKRAQALRAAYADYVRRYNLAEVPPGYSFVEAGKRNSQPKK